MNTYFPEIKKNFGFGCMRLPMKDNEVDTVEFCKMVDAFLDAGFNMSDAYHIAEPLISNTPLTAWVMAPMYAIGYALVLWVVEIIKKRSKKKKYC